MLTGGIERTFPRPFSETFRISKNEDFNGPYLENKNEFLKNSLETVFMASKSCDRGQLVSAFQLTFKGVKITSVGLKLDRPQLQQWLLFLEHNTINKLRSIDLNVVGLPVSMGHDCVYGSACMKQAVV